MERSRQSVSDLRGAAASAAVSVGCGAVVYSAIGDLSVDRSARGEAYFVGPISIPAYVLVGSLVVTVVVGLVGAVQMMRWTRDGRVRRGWTANAFGGCAAAAVSAWSWRTQTASYVVGGSLHIWLAIGAAVAAWTVVLVRWASFVRSVRGGEHRHRGCRYCSQEINLLHGDVHMVSANEARQTLLLRCPRCGWLYAAITARPELAEPISEAQARELFPSTW